MVIHQISLTYLTSLLLGKGASCLIEEMHKAKNMNNILFLEKEKSEEVSDLAGHSQVSSFERSKWNEGFVLGGKLVGRAIFSTVANSSQQCFSSKDELV